MSAGPKRFIGFRGCIVYELCNAQGGMLEFEDCGEHCHLWEFWSLGLDRQLQF